MPNGKDEVIPLKPMPDQDQNHEDLNPPDEDSSFLDILKYNKPKENGHVNGRCVVESQDMAKLNQIGVKEKVTFV